MKDIEEEERISVKQAKAKNAGYTGLSILHRLYALYGFEYDRDLVYDELHAFSLNIVKNHIQFLKTMRLLLIGKRLTSVWIAFLGQRVGCNVFFMVIKKNYLLRFFFSMVCLYCVEYKASRIPNGLVSRIGYWKGKCSCIKIHISYFTMEKKLFEEYFFFQPKNFINLLFLHLRLYFMDFFLKNRVINGYAWLE